MRSGPSDDVRDRCVGCSVPGLAGTPRIRSWPLVPVGAPRCQRRPNIDPPSSINGQYSDVGDTCRCQRRARHNDRSALPARARPGPSGRARTAGRRAVITSSGRCWLRSGPRPQSCGQLAGLYFYTSPPTSRTYYSAADRVFLDRRDADAPLVEHAARVHGPLTVRLTVGNGAGDERQRPRPGHSDAVDLPGLHPCQAPDPGTSPGNVTAEPAGCGSVRQDAGGRGCPERPHPCLGITLSDVSEQGERAHSRRSGRQFGCIGGHSRPR